MSYSADRPIDTVEQDLLGRGYFSSQLGRAVYEYNAKDGLVIGLFGKWGTGKTSVLNMAENEIKKLTENEIKKPLIMRFYPWNYSDKDNLISLYFKSLKNKISLQDNEELRKKVGKALSDYSSAFDALSIIPVMGSGLAVVLKTLAKVQGEHLMQKTDLDETRKKLENALVEVDNKIIIIIDDIDRLSNQQIRDVFQLVKQVADFPNVIYILSMDREVVCRALSDVHGIDGSQYLEKIIQVPFEIPELRKNKLNDIFMKKISKTISDITYEVVWDEKYWNEIFRNCVEPYIKTLRDINRVINTFKFRYDMLHEETSFEDMVAITTLEVLEPQLYKWISENKEAVCGGFTHAFSRAKDKIDYYKLYSDEFVKMGVNPKLAISCLSTMFPIFSKDINKYQWVNKPTSDVRAKMRIACEGRFELYFMFDLDDIKISRNKINLCIYKLDRENLIRTIQDIDNQDEFIYFIEEIESLVDNIPYIRLDLIVSVILNLPNKLISENRRSIFARNAFDIIENIIYKVINRFDNEKEKYNFICCNLANTNKLGLGSMARIINRIELAYGRIREDYENEEEQIISLKQLEELENKYIEKIRSIASDDTLLDINEFNIVFHLWKLFDEDGTKNYIEALFENNVDKLKFICAEARGWNSNKGRGWNFNPNDYSEYISQEDILIIIQNFDKNNLDKFTDVEQIKLASFVMNYNKDITVQHNEEVAKELLKEWKNGNISK